MKKDTTTFLSKSRRSPGQKGPQDKKGGFGVNYLLFVFALAGPRKKPPPSLERAAKLNLIC
jgi:hypothetical protein